jgi:glycine/D-amino acid oxidase-like deaminating enzyme
MAGHALVVGAGIYGLCTAWSLTKRGWRVTLVDRGPIPNPSNSSYDEHRIIRHAYGAMRGYALMMPAAFHAWDDLWSDLGRDHLEKTTQLYCLRLETDWYEKVSRDLDDLGIAYRDLPLDALDQYPMISRRDLKRVVETDGSGLLFADRIVEDLCAWLSRQPTVTLRANRAIDAIDPVTATARAGSETLTADKLVVATGVWIERLIGPLPERPKPSIQVVLYLNPPADYRAAWATSPLISNRLNHPAAGTYILPPLRGSRLKVGIHAHSLIGDPEQPWLPTPALIEGVREAAALTIADFERYQVTEAKACYYSVTPDDHLAVRPMTDAAWLISACSGHGFKLAALLGQKLAAALDGDGASSLPDYAAGRVGV